MKTAIFFMVVLFTNPSIEDEKEAISTTLSYYMDGGTNRSFETLQKAFHPDAIMTINNEEGLKQVNAREFFSKMKPGDPLKRTCKIVSIDIEGTTAVARLHLEDDRKIFHDFMTLLKVDGTWVIVNKSFYTEYKN
ncbi:MAG: nuclear transport factor 2 family protein [bacterium]|nr:nuclear transport factor 2 family protein [bacterium]